MGISQILDFKTVFYDTVLRNGVGHFLFSYFPAKSGKMEII
jgi:hypothetical protein